MSIYGDGKHDNGVIIEDVGQEIFDCLKAPMQGETHAFLTMSKIKKAFPKWTFNNMNFTVNSIVAEMVDENEEVYTIEITPWGEV